MDTTTGIAVSLSPEIDARFICCGTPDGEDNKICADPPVAVVLVPAADEPTWSFVVCVAHLTRMMDVNTSIKRFTPPT